MTTHRRSLAAALAAAVAVALALPAGAEVVTRLVMRINDQVVTLGDYEKRKADLERAVLDRDDLTLQQRRDLLAEAGERIFRQMYEELLLLSRAEQLGLTVTEQEIDDQIGRIREQMGLETDEDFANALASSGMDLAELREQTRRNLLSQMVLGREVYAKIDIDEQILRRYYRDHPEEFQVPERRRLREVVVLEEATPDAGERRRMATEVREQVLTGRVLEELAAERSATGVTSDLIDIGWVSAGDLAPELEEAVWGLDLGALSEPIEARGGTHLVEVLESEPASVRPFSEVADAIRALHRQRRAAEETEEYVARLEQQAFIRLDPPPEAEGFRSLAAEPPAGPELTVPEAAHDGAEPGASGAEDGIERVAGEDGTGRQPKVEDDADPSPN